MYLYFGNYEDEYTFVIPVLSFVSNELINGYCNEFERVFQNRDFSEFRLPIYGIGESRVILLI